MSQGRRSESYPPPDDCAFDSRSIDIGNTVITGLRAGGWLRGAGGRAILRSKQRGLAVVEGVGITVRIHDAGVVFVLGGRRFCRKS